MEREHPWKLVGPWYDHDAASRAAWRASGPSIQKYETPRCVADFIRDPLSSIGRTGDDRVAQAGGSVLKLFQPAHKRFYLVVAELHCDAAGFPSAAREDVCEAGFVVRRCEPSGAKSRWVRETWDGFNRDPKGDARKAPKVPFESIGRWTPFDAAVTEVGPALDEVTFRMYPLVADPREKGHPGEGRAIFFGMIVTANGETTDTSEPALSEVATYEIRCFVRRHPKGCRKKPGGGDCHGPVTWSEPSEPFRLASFFDPVGCGYAPVNIKMPDVSALRQLGTSVRPSVTMTTPPNSAPDVDPVTQKPRGSGFLPGGLECSFPIPLITIVATFVFQIFLAILMPVVGFLLSLKICIPTLAVDAAVTPAPQFPARPRDLSLKADVSVSAHAGVSS